MGDMPHSNYSCRGCRIISTLLIWPLSFPFSFSSLRFFFCLLVLQLAKYIPTLYSRSPPSKLWWCVPPQSLCFYPRCWICVPITFTLNDWSLSYLVMPTTLELFIYNLEKIDSWLCERENYILIFFVPLALSTNMYVCKLMTQMIISGITFSFP